MKASLAALVLLGIVTVSYAQQNPPARPKPTEHFILPPVEFDHNYEGDLTIKIVDTVAELQAACGLNDPSLLACSIRASKACLILMVPDYIMRRRLWTSGLLLRHEIGHCNGWPGDHPGQRAVLGGGSYHVLESQRPVARNASR